MKLPPNETLGDYFGVRKEKGEPGLPTLSVTMYDGLVDRSDLDRTMQTNLAPDQHLKVREGDIAYNMMRMWQGAFGRAEKDGIVSPAYVVVEPLGAMDSRFAAHWFKTARMIHLFWAYSYGLTEDRLRLYLDDFCQIPASPPPLPEQRKIVDILDTWDHAISQTGALIEAKQKLLNGLIRKLSQNRWMPIALGDLGRWVSGGTPSKSNAGFWQGKIPWVSPKDMSGWRIQQTDDCISSDAIHQSSTRLVPPGTVLVVTRSGVLRNTVPSGVVEMEAAFNQDIKALLVDGPWSGSLIALVLRWSSDKIRQSCVKSGTTVESIDLEALKSFAILLPRGSGAIEEAQSIIVRQAMELDLLGEQLKLLRVQKDGLVGKLIGCGQRFIFPRSAA